MLALDLLKYAAMGLPSNADAGAVRPPEHALDREIQWLLDAGMGPLLHRAVRSEFVRVPDAWRDVLLSADLTAQARHGKAIETTTDVIDVCSALGTPVTLLKGISISEQHYPAGHLRPMGDIDVLVPADARASVEAALLRRGYIPKLDHRLEENIRHGIPLCHPDYHAWVEVHGALFDDVRQDSIFGPSNIAAQSVESMFHGKSVNRLSDELQLMFLASSWIADLSRYGINMHPSCLPALLDATFILNVRTLPLDVDRLVGWPGSQMAVASLYVMLAYLVRRGITQQAAAVLPVLASSQKVVGGLQLRLIHGMLDRYLLGGRSWDLVLPPPVPGRYSIRHQLRKRFFGRRRVEA